MPDDPPSADASSDLLRRCADGDRAAFRALYDLWGRQLHGIALRITRQSELAADATHDTFVQIWQHADRFDPARGSAAAFLISMARYRALDIVRRRGREVGGYEAEERVDETPDALHQLAAAADGAALHRCLGELATDRRKLIVLAFVDGLSHGDLAERFRLPLGTIKSSIRRGLLSLRECLAS